MSDIPASRRVRNLFGLLTAGAFLLIGYGIWFQLFRDEALRPVEAVTSPESGKGLLLEENGYSVLYKTLGGETWPKITPQQEEILSQAKPWDPAVMRPLVEAAPAMKACVEKALRQPKWDYSLENIFYHSYVWAPVTILIAQARQLALADLPAESLDLIRQACLLMSQMEQKGMKWVDIHRILKCHAMIGSALMHLAEARGIERGTLAEAMKLIGATVIEPDQYRRAIQEEVAAGLSPTAVSVKTLDEHEFCEMTRLLTQSKLPDWFILTRYKERASVNLYATHFTRLADLGLREGVENRKIMQEFRESMMRGSQLPLLSFDPNRAGRVRVSSSAWVAAIKEARLFSLEACRRCGVAVLAAKSWSMDHEGKHLKDLAELVPDYLPAVPLDPYDGKPVRWVPATGMAYVSGEDGTDEVPVAPPGCFSGTELNGSWALLP